MNQHKNVRFDGQKTAESAMRHFDEALESAKNSFERENFIVSTFERKQCSIDLLARVNYANGAATNWTASARWNDRAAGTF